MMKENPTKSEIRWTEFRRKMNESSLMLDQITGKGRPWIWHKSKGHFWFRIFGKGLAFTNRNIHKLSFSIRHGYRKVIWIGNWTIEVLR